jgi:hypothetical protein
VLFDETFILNPTSNGEGRIIKGIIHQTTNLGQQIARANTGFEGHAQGLEVVLPPTPNQFQNELDNLLCQVIQEVGQMKNGSIGFGTRDNTSRNIIG